VWNSFFAIPEEMPGAGDGDGDDDVVTFTRAASADVYVGLSNRTGTFTSQLWQVNFGGPRGTYRVADVNGDRRADILRFTQDSAGDVYVALSTGTGFGAESLWHGWFAP
jgi:FG-GAP-like repeat